MIFTWDYKNLCIVFRWWHIRSFGGLLISIVAIIALCAGYEAVRSLSSRYETQVAAVSAQQAQRTREDDSSMYLYQTSHGLACVEAHQTQTQKMAYQWNQARLNQGAGQETLADKAGQSREFFMLYRCFIPSSSCRCGQALLDLDEGSDVFTGSSS